MLQDILSIGDKVHIRQVDHSGKPIRNIQPYVSQLVDFDDTKAIHISAPIVNNQIYLLESNRRYNLCFYTGKGLYQCTCEVIEKCKDNNIVILKVMLISDLEKLQRRQYYRLEMLHEIDYRLVSKEEEQIERLMRQLMQSEIANSVEVDNLKKKLKELDHSWETTTITDLSGGGTRFNSKKIHQPGDKLKIRLDFITSGHLKKLIIDSVIVSASKLINLPGVYEYRVEFMNIRKKDRDDLIKYIFEQERRRRKNENG